MFNWIFKFGTAIANIFTAKQQGKNDQIEQGTAKVGFATALASTHNFLIDSGLGMVVFSCGFAFMHDKILMPIFHLSGPQLTDANTWQLISAMFACGALHYVRNMGK